MRLMNCMIEGIARLVPLHDGLPRDLYDRWPDAPTGIEQLLEADLATWDRLRATIRNAPELTAPIDRYDPPIRNPGKILCVGKNYADHAKEMGSEVPGEPIIFSKLTSSLTGHECQIRLPAESSQVDYEAELVVIVGKSGRHILAKDAMDHVLGYTCGHDVSARDWQKNKPGGQWLLGKSFDGFGPLGPTFVTADEIDDVHNLSIEFRLNGQVMQKSNTRFFLFTVPQLIAYISQVCTLERGDLLWTGTPDGVGIARRPPVFLRPGDVAEVDIEGLGLLRNTFV